MEHSQDIASFYAGQSVLITGATGFIGKVSRSGLLLAHGRSSKSMLSATWVLGLNT